MDVYGRARELYSRTLPYRPSRSRRLKRIGLRLHAHHMVYGRDAFSPLRSTQPAEDLPLPRWGGTRLRVGRGAGLRWGDQALRWRLGARRAVGQRAFPFGGDGGWGSLVGRCLCVELGGLAARCLRGDRCVSERGGGGEYRFGVGKDKIGRV